MPTFAGSNNRDGGRFLANCGTATIGSMSCGMNRNGTVFVNTSATIRFNGKTTDFTRERADGIPRPKAFGSLRRRTSWRIGWCRGGRARGRGLPLRRERRGCGERRDWRQFHGTGVSRGVSEHYTEAQVFSASQDLLTRRGYPSLSRPGANIEIRRIRRIWRFWRFSREGVER